MVYVEFSGFTLRFVLKRKNLIYFRLLVFRTEQTRKRRRVKTKRPLHAQNKRDFRYQSSFTRVLLTDF